MKFSFTITILCTIALSVQSSFGQNKTSLNFSPMEAIDTLAIPAVNHLNRPIKAINKEAFIIDTYENVSGLFLVKKIRSNWVVFKMEFQGFYSDLEIKGDLITYRYYTSGAAQGTTYSYSYFCLVNTTSPSSLALIEESLFESWTLPSDQRPDESDAAYEKRSAKETNRREESCSSTIDFDGKCLYVKRKEKKNCNDCLASRKYRLVNGAFM